MHIAVIGLGEAGTLYAQGLLGQGWTVTGFDPAAVPTPDGVLRAPTPRELVEHADAVLSLVGGRAAIPAARSVVEHLSETAVFIDMNSAAPETKLEVAAIIGESRYADVAVAGSVPEHGAATPVVISGAGSTGAAEVFAALGAPVENVHGLPGDAAKRKLLRSSFMKGLGALIVETLEAGEAMGAREWALGQMADEHSGGVESVERLYSGTLKHAERRGHEAEEAAAMLDGLGVRSVMSRAAATSHLLAASTQTPNRAELAAAYAGVPVANIGDARDRMGMADSGIRAMWRGAKAVGWARTVWVAQGDNKVIHTALDSIEPGDFLIVNGHGHTDRALLGELMAEKARKLGAVGIVADGALRDIRELEAMGFPAWARAASPAGPYKNGPGYMNVPVAIGGVVVTPGDLVVADEDGVIVVPGAEAEQTLTRALAIQEDEANRRRAIIEGNFA